MIEGDNYHALSVLNYTHKEKIDIIYIDPPYNLGKEFIYNDKLVDKEDSYKHSKWLSFMNKRLKLSKKLLSKTGVIFISIDDNEQAQLRLLCDDVFGAENFIANIVWQKKQSPQNDAQYFSDMHDFILVYAKRKNGSGKKDGWIRQLIPRTQQQNERYQNPDDDPRGSWSSSGLDVKTYNAKYDYQIKTPSGRIVKPPQGRCWRVHKTRFKELVADNRIWFGKNGNNVPRFKRFLSDVQNGVVPTTWWERTIVGDNQEATQELKKILHSRELVFNTPKPVRLLKRIIQIASGQNSYVLDFFAGSGTTGHAVLQLNKEDRANHKFILCTNNENSICTDICYPRLKKVIRGHRNSKGEKIKGLGGNLRYFKTDFADTVSTDQNQKNIVKKSTDMLCLKEDCFEIVKQDNNFTIFRGCNDKHLGVIYHYDGIALFKKAASKLNKKIITYTFSLGDVIDNDDFVGVKNLIVLKPIPSAILNAYRRICTNA